MKKKKTPHLEIIANVVPPNQKSVQALREHTASWATNRQITFEQAEKESQAIMLEGVEEYLEPIARLWCSSNVAPCEHNLDTTPLYYLGTRVAEELSRKADEDIDPKLITEVLAMLALQMVELFRGLKVGSVTVQGIQRCDCWSCKLALKMGAKQMVLNGASDDQSLLN